ncbi:MAG: DUF2971 domain-containing protein [Proteobacteria bacterium]|nr:DUF2971 domain-containing protein [Pseudomonadota bacterium]
MTIVERIRRYKYLPFNERTLRIITEGTIKFTRPSELNDPFDCAPDVETGNIEEYLNARPDLLEGAGNILKLSPAQRIKEKQTMIKRLEKAVVQGALSQQAADKVGICSLTRDPLNLLMWAHYAQHHTGFVVEFNIPLIITDIDKSPTDQGLKWLIPHEVEYQKSKPVINFFDDKNTKARKQFLVKGEDWKYEQEERVIDYVRGHGIHKYDRKSILHSVIVGMKMSNRNYATLMEFIDKTNQDMNLSIRVHKSAPVKVKGKFELFVSTRSDLKPISR